MDEAEACAIDVARVELVAKCFLSFGRRFREIDTDQLLSMMLFFILQRRSVIVFASPIFLAHLTRIKVYIERSTTKVFTILANNLRSPLLLVFQS